VGIAGGEDRLEPRLLGSELVEVGIRLGVGGIDGIELGLGAEELAQAFLHRLAHGVFRVELRFLLEIAHLDAGLRAGLADEIGVHAGHDPQDGRLAGAVEAEQADLRAGEEGQRDVLEDLALGRNGLADTVHGV